VADRRPRCRDWEDPPSPQACWAAQAAEAAEEQRRKPKLVPAKEVARGRQQPQVGPAAAGGRDGDSRRQQEATSLPGARRAERSRVPRPQPAALPMGFEPAPAPALSRQQAAVEPPRAVEPALSPSWQQEAMFSRNWGGTPAAQVFAAGRGARAARGRVWAPWPAAVWRCRG
jgi:hypothetical protein